MDNLNISIAPKATTDLDKPDVWPEFERARQGGYDLATYRRASKDGLLANVSEAEIQILPNCIELPKAGNISQRGLTSVLKLEL